MKELTLKDLREQAGLSVKEVAARLHIATSSYYNYEQGIREIGISQVLILAELFSTTEKEVIEAQLNSHRCAQ